ncbi:FadR/GntR family transcriptional regulator [Burkholderia pseudomallei]|uniref:FadR/GntR family transcriptional regulator n=1 Tax=Burkholderia pseudomallei TaxID=28450 RepID=UPI000811B5E2|nr:FCD domain-containing protein [Burkholderia pseudomallei]ANW52789.1 GntR family transcriptional regulator [Burkholderia pseudomallei]ANW60448.1 GntR family transcriptional regulator [Burkholderia pseudomallei]MCS6600094.1 FCD domain-containing protein [Burkholderia pseudomallei]
MNSLDSNHLLNPARAPARPLGDAAERRSLKASPRVQRVLDELITRIVDGEYTSGLLPPQDVLARELGVPRSVMREVTRMLTARRMLHARTKAGTRLTPRSEWRLFDDHVMQWRMRIASDTDFLLDVAAMCDLIEPEAAAQVALHSDDTQRRAVRAAHAALRDALEPDALRRALELLHASIVEASRNQFIRQMAEVARAGVMAIDLDAATLQERNEAIRDAAAKLVAAIDGRDADGARTAMIALRAAVNETSLDPA